MRSGQRVIGAVLVVCAVILAVFWWGADAEDDSGAGTRESADLVTEDRAAGGTRVAQTYRELVTDIPRVDAIGRVELDTRPRQPDETPRSYEWRKGVVDAFDEFRRRTGISDETAQAALLVLYDFQENEAILRRMFAEASKQGNEAWMNLDADTIHLRADNLKEARAGLDALFTEKEGWVWRRTMDQAGVWFHLAFHRYIHRPDEPDEAMSDEQ